MYLLLFPSAALCVYLMSETSLSQFLPMDPILLPLKLSRVLMAGKALVMGSAHHKIKSALPNHEVIGHCDEEAVAHYFVKNLLE
ncbi:hypothetical protein [Psychromonas ingrahamii]|uniref:hypothetical protein n=1 Tax=Psychromonas ingrahamii TaxID=357794 RepID=UPI0005A06EC8|nr:hypothetical protein [Psychromonas ingrahamii]